MNDWQVVQIQDSKWCRRGLARKELLCPLDCIRGFGQRRFRSKGPVLGAPDPNEPDLGAYFNRLR